MEDQAQTQQTANAEEAAFIEQFSTKMEKASAADEPEEEKKESESESESEKPESEKKGDEEDDAEPEPEPEKKSDDAESEKKKKDSEDLDDDEAAPDKVDEATAAALKKHGLKLTMDDVPEAVRPILQKKMAHVDAVLTRALQDARGYRKTEREVLAERKYFEEHPDLYLAEQFYRLSPEQRDELVVKVQAQLERFTSTDGAKLFEHETKEERDAARHAVDEQYTVAEHRMQRADEIAVYARTASVRLGLPWEHVENAVVVALSQKPEDTRDLTEAELDAIIDKQARIWRRHSVAIVREDKKTAIRERTKDRATTSPAVRIGGAGAPLARTPTTKIAANDEEFIEQFIAKQTARSS